MKKIVLLLMIGLMGGAYAQTKQAAKPTPSVKKTTTHLKKDGTPDKRFKEHKTNAAGPKKKDGTPDMRFKKNKSKISSL